jgi:H+/Cl- antiporter ClcA
MTGKNIFWSVVLGALSGLLISIYFLGLVKINDLHAQHPGLILILPFTFLLLVLVKRSSDFYPTSFKEIRSATQTETVLWSRWTVPLNLLLSLVSHLSGASLGRESTAVVISTATINIFKLDWNFWRPILVASSFSIATGYPLLSFFVLIELFFSSVPQKILTLICSWVGVLVLKSMAIPPLFSLVDFDFHNKSFFSSVIFSIVLGFVCGYLARYFKSASEWLKMKNKNHRTRLSVMWSFFLTLVIAGLMIKFDLSIYKSLSLDQFSALQVGKISYEFFLIKMILTMICVSVGFIGGEFVPSLLIGASVGVLLSPIFSEGPGFGFALGLLAFFAGLSKMKWTAVMLTLMYFDFSTTMWAYITIMISDSMSGDKKLF